MGLIPEDIISQVIERSDIVQSVSSYVPLKKAGRNFKACCPFHNEKTPSFVVNPDKQIFHCFGCGVGGNVVSFVIKQENVEFPEAIRMLADKAGIFIPSHTDPDDKTRGLKQSIFNANNFAVDFFYDCLLKSKTKDVTQARDYLKKRGVNLEIVKKFKFGFAYDNWDSLLLHLRKKNISIGMIEKAGLIVPKEKKNGFYDRFRNRIIFPIFDIKSRCVAFGARTLKEGLAKYINSPETLVYTKGKHLYGLNAAKDAILSKDHVIVVEGYMDFIMPFQAGVENIVASLGTALTIDQIRLLRRFTRNVVMLFDTDQAGESAMIRSLDLLIEEGMNVKVASLSKGEDPDSFIRKFGVEKFEECISTAKSLFDYKIDSLLGKYDRKTIDGRTKIASEMLTTINKFDNAVTRSEYVKRLADILLVSQTALKTELKKVFDNDTRNAYKRRPVAVAKVSPGKGKGKKRKAEYGILRTMLKDKDLIPETKQKISLSDLQDDSIREIIEKVYELYEGQNNFNASNLISCFSDENILQIISSLMAQDDDYEGDVEKVHRDCLNRIVDDSVKIHRKEILQQMREAQVAGDKKWLEDLTQEFNEVMKKTAKC